MIVGNGEHRTNRRIDPVTLQEPPALHGGGRGAEELVDRGAEAAAGVVTGVDLRADHRFAGSDAFHRIAQAAQSGDLQKAHAETALEGAPHGGGIMAKRHHILLTPAPRRFVFQRRQQLRYRFIGRAIGEHRFAALAGAEPRLQAFGDGLAEPAVFDLRFARRAGEAAEDFGRGHAHIGHAFIGGVLVHKGGIQGFGVGAFEQHHDEDASAISNGTPPKNGRRCGGFVSSFLPRRLKEKSAAYFFSPAGPVAKFRGCDSLGRG